MTDQRIKGEEQILGMTVLNHLTIFFQLKMDVIGIGQFTQWHKLTEGCRPVEAFCYFPGMPFLLLP